MSHKALVHLSDDEQALLVGETTVFEDDFGHKLSSIDAFCKWPHLDLI